jgi:hypothetical protein
MPFITPNYLTIFIVALLLCGSNSLSEAASPQQSDNAAQSNYTLLISEDFEQEPKLSFFPRVGVYRPEDDDTKNLQYWRTYINHIEKTSGVVEGFGKDGGRILGLRSINGAPTLGLFAPLEVSASTDYNISFTCRSKLPEGARAGLRIYEFDSFVMQPSQLSMSQLEDHLVDLQSEAVITGQHEWDRMTLNFTTGDKTRMVHIYFFREGTHDRLPTMIDNITIKERTAANKQRE